MARTRLRQLEQIRNSLAYDDNLNMAAAEGQADSTIGTPAAVIVSFTTSTIVVEGDYINAGANKDDSITVASASINNGTYKITNLSYNSGLDETTVTVSSTLTAGAGSGNATLKIDLNKNLRRDLDHIRTQLRLLGQTTNWYDPPMASDSVNYQLVTGSAIAAGTDIVLTSDFDAGEPYTLKVYVNGVLMMPSTVVSNAVSTAYDYEERDSSQPVGTSEVGTRVRFNFSLVASDIVQFKWTKKP